MPAPVRLLLIGAIGRPHGVRGAVRVHPFNPGSPLWTAGQEVALVPPEALPEGGAPQVDVLEAPEAFAVRLLRVADAGKGTLSVTLEGVEGREAAEALRGAVLGVPPELLDEPEEDAFWFHEVPGWRVEGLDGALLGHVVRALDGHVDLLEVRPAAGGPTFYVPVVAPIVVRIDRAAGRVVLDPPEGLVP